MTMIVSDLVADLLADESQKSRKKSQASRKHETVAALIESQQSQESQGVCEKRDFEGTQDRYRRWAMTLPGGTTEVLSYTPAKTLAEVQGYHPEAASLTPCQTPTQPTRKALTPSQAAVVASGLDEAGEDDPEIRREVLERCATDPEALSFWLARAPDARPALYREWLAGIEEPRALVTLSDTQARQAVAAGVVTRDTARASVLILAKASGAIGLLAIPREKYADFGPVAALEALQWTH